MVYSAAQALHSATQVRLLHGHCIPVPRCVCVCSVGRNKVEGTVWRDVVEEDVLYDTGLRHLHLLNMSMSLTWTHRRESLFRACAKEPLRGFARLTIYTYHVSKVQLHFFLCVGQRWPW